MSIVGSNSSGNTALDAILAKMGQTTGPNTPAAIGATTAAPTGGGVPNISMTQSTGANNFMTSPAMAALISGGLGMASGIASNHANAADAAAARKQQLQMMLSGTADAERSDNLSRDNTYLNSTQNNPVKQQQDLFRASIMKTMAEHGAPQVQRGGVVNAPNLGDSGRFLGDDALASAASRYYTAAGTMSPSAPSADLSKMGFKTDTSGLQQQQDASIQGARDQRTALNQRQRDDLTGAVADTELDAHKAAKDDDWLEEHSPAPQGMHWHDGELSEDGSGFWHKFAKYAGIAGAGVATVMTGGAASPALIAAIGAGSGAAAGWGSGGGVKGALIGAGLGAIPGAGSIGSKAAGTVANVGGRSAMDIAKSVLTNPTVAGNIAGSALGQGAGTATSAGLDYFNRRSVK